MALVLPTSRMFMTGNAIGAMYDGDDQVWEQMAWNPLKLPGLVAWLDAQFYLPGSWPNSGSGPAITIVGTPAMPLSANTLNGLPVVRFKTNEGRVRSTWPYPVYDWTLLYLVRWVGPGVGRAWTVQYPPSNLLVGLHTSQPDWLYDNGGGITPGTSWAAWAPGPGPWRMYGADQETNQGMAFFINGAQIGARLPPVPSGLTNGWAISGYDPVTPGETMDIEVAEMLLWNRRLSDTDRQLVEAYLREKWAL